MIILNIVTLINTDWSVRVYPEKKNRLKNKIVHYSDYYFTTVFTVELILKVVGMGFVFEKNTYLRDGWNIIGIILKNLKLEKKKY